MDLETLGTTELLLMGRVAACMVAEMQELEMGMRMELPDMAAVPTAAELFMEVAARLAAVIRNRQEKIFLLQRPEVALSHIKWETGCVI